MPTVLIPGLLASARLYAPQLPELWRRGPVLIADHTRADSMSEIAKAVLEAAPVRFALVGLSMGGYVAFEILRQAPQRVSRLALLDTTARPDTPEQTQARNIQIALTHRGQFEQIPAMQFPALVSRARHGDERLRALLFTMAQEVGAEAFVRQQTAIMHRPDSRPTLASIRCPTLVLVGAEDTLTPPERARETAAGITGARLVQVADSGHLSTLEQPEAVSRALLAWLDS